MIVFLSFRQGKTLPARGRIGLLQYSKAPAEVKRTPQILAGDCGMHDFVI